MKLALVVLPLMLACAHVQTSPQAHKPDRIIRMSTGYQVDVPQGWVRVDNGDRTVRPSYEELTLLHQETRAALSIITTEHLDHPSQMLAMVGQRFVGRGGTASEASMCLDVEDGIEMLLHADNVSIRVIAVNSDRFTFILQGFSIDNNAIKQSEVVTDLIHHFKVLK